MNTLKVFITAVASAIGTIVEPGFGTLVGTTVGNFIGAGLGSLITDVLAKGPKPSPPGPDDQPVNLAAAALTIDSAMKKEFDQSFDLLNSTKFLTDVYSNYGLLEAMGRMEFTTPDASSQAAAISPTRQGFDASVWADLLPRVYKWKLMPYTGDSDQTDLPNFTFFRARSEDATWQNPDDQAPLDPRDPRWDKIDQYYTYADLKKKWMLPDTDAQFTDKVAEEVENFQNAQEFMIAGNDFTPDGWFGPGPLSVAWQLTGNPASFYVIATKAHLEQTVYRTFENEYWKAWTRSDGDAIEEWSLVSREQVNGQNVPMPADVATALFGPIPQNGLALSGANLTQSIGDYAGGQYVNVQVPAGGVATRFQVFSQWGKGTKDFSPYTFRPANDSSGDMTVFLNPTNKRYADFGNTWARYKLTYG